MLHINKILILFLILGESVCFAQQDQTDIIVDSGKESIVVLNDQLRRTSRRLRELEGGVSLTTGVTGILPVSKGGTGKDLSTATTGTIPYFSSTGVLGNIGIGTSGYVITSNGTIPTYQPSKMPGTPVILRWGQIDALTSSTGGIVSSQSSLTSAAPTIDAPTGKYVYWAFTQNSYENVLQQEPVYFQKKTGINTVSGNYYIWEQSGGAGGGGGRSVSCYFDIGSQVSSTATSQSTTPTSTSWSVDVSGLTNGTNYEIKLMCKDNKGGSNETTGYVAKIIGFES